MSIVAKRKSTKRADALTGSMVHRFTLPNAPKAFQEVLWEAEYSARGLKRLSLLSASDTTAAAEMPPLSSESKTRLKTLQRMLLERLKGGRSDMEWDEFDLDDKGNFHRRVWKAMRNIPFGETATYAQVAGDAGSPLAFRACGQACGANPIIIFIPCHRVVSSTGLGGFGCGLEWKKKLLGMERE